MKYILTIVVVLLVIIGATFFSKDNSVVSVDETNNDRIETTSGGATINLSGKNLTKAPEYIFNQDNVEVLDLSHNLLEGSLQAEIRLIKNLRVLDLSDNNFTGVPAEVGQLSQLEILDLSNNPITGLPYEIGNLTNLRVLDLRGTNYAVQDLEIIKQKLSSGVEIRTD
ncbi:leucine-rich repeat domain-containing protein [Candidatus Nomurabacteria bacterium]|nr:leucine-rich repeat domain-containing protein [Candidatus Nomurabacteria bacterium]